MRQLLVESDDIVSISKGRALSQCGQVYAYLQDTQAEEYFEQALAQFDEKSIDYNITLSYLLHHYIDMNNRDGYEKYASQYFGGHDNVWEQFSYLKDMTEADQKLQSFKFAFYVFIKALYIFYVDELNSEKRRNLLSWAQNLHRGNKSEHVNGHPWELIYKYFALLAVKFNKNELAEEFIQLTKTIVQERAAAIDNIICGGLIEYYNTIGKNELAEETTKKFTNQQLKDGYETMLGYMFR